MRHLISVALNTDQQLAVRDLLEQNRPEQAGDRETSRAAVDAGLQSILTDDQLEVFRTAQESRGGRPPGGPGGNAHGKGEPRG